MTYLIAHEEEIYPRLAKLGEQARRTIEAAFGDEGVFVRCTGDGNRALGGSSLFMFHFPYQEDARLDRPEDVVDPSVCDVTLRRDVLQIALLLEDVYVIHGHGSVATTHTEAAIELLGEACRRVVGRLKPYL